MAAWVEDWVREAQPTITPESGTPTPMRPMIMTGHGAGNISSRSMTPSTVRYSAPAIVIGDRSDHTNAPSARDDPVVGAEQSKLLYEALNAKGVEVKLELIEGAGHGGREFSTPQRQKLLLDFFDLHLKK